MRVAGIAVAIPRPARPVSRLAVVKDGPSEPVIETAESFPSDNVSIPEQLHDLAESIRSRLIGLDVDRVVIRRADRSPISRNGDGPRLRLLAEGAITTAARSVVIDTRIETGRSAALLYGASKSDHELAAVELAVQSGLGREMAEAIAAGLAGLAAT